MGETVVLGARIRELRGDFMTQRELADKAQVSVALIRKLEQGRRHTASVVSLQKIARALDVTIAHLLSKPASMDPSGEGSVVAIRRALTPVDDLLDQAVIDDGEPLTLDAAERTVDYLWGAYWAGRYELLGSLLPATLPQMRATLRAVPVAKKPAAAHALARAYQAAGDTLVHLGQQDAAFLAIHLARQEAKKGQDELLDSSLRVSVAWQLLVQGRYDESERVARVGAEKIEPSGDVTDSQMSAYGVLAVTGATAAARAHNNSAATELLDVARGTAERLGYERADHQTTFGPAKVTMLSVDVHVVQDNFVEALTASRTLPRDAVLPLATRARHLADVALSQLRLGHHQKAMDTLFAMESIAPEWIKFQRLPQLVCEELLTHERPSRLRELAKRIGATAR